MPVGFANETMEYNIVREDGIPITVSKLKMKNNFTAYEQNGIRNLLVFSSINYGWRSEVTHGFPNLTYKDTMSIKSDPEITVFHDRIQIPGGTIGNGQIGHITGPNWALVAVVWVIIGIIIAVAVLVIKKYRRKKRVS